MATETTLGNLYVEWARRLNSRKGLMVPVSYLDNICQTYDPGYRSVYMFKEADAEEIKAARSSKGLDKYEVYSDGLMIDLDQGQEQLFAVEKILLANGLEHSVWTSGGKGYHVRIPHVLVGSKDLPYSHAKAIKELGIDCDTTLYQHGRIISLEGRIHPKTRIPKSFLYTVPGKELDLKLTPKPPPRFDFSALDSENGALSRGLFNLALIADREPTPGNRHMVIWQTAKDLAAAGLGMDTVLELLTEVNSTWQQPKTAAEVEAAVRGAFKSKSTR